MLTFLFAIFLFVVIICIMAEIDYYATWIILARLILIVFFPVFALRFVYLWLLNQSISYQEFKNLLKNFWFEGRA